MIRLSSVLICLLLIHPPALSNEIGGADSPQNSSEQVPGLDFSNVEPRDNVNLCSEQDLQERQEQQNQCVQRFGEMGITQTIRPHEVVEAQSCDRIEGFSEYLSGCAQFFSEMPGDAIGGIASLFGAGQHDQQIQQACGERPNQPRGASRRASRVGIGRVSATERAQLGSYNSRLDTYNNCSNGVVEAAEQADANLEAQIAGYRSQCRSSFAAGGRGNQRRLARHGDRHIKSCMLNKAGRDGCDACIAQLTEVPIGPRIIQSVLDEFRKYRGFSCYNKETQGRMVCAAIATAAGLPLGGAAASLAAKLPAAFRSAQAAARAPVSRLRVAADAAEEAAEETAEAASNIAAVQAGRVTEEALEANGALSDVDRVVAAQRLLDDRNLSPEQSRAIVRAHEVGADRPGSGYGNYTQGELREKNRLLTEAGFSAEDRRLLMDQGIVGRMPEPVAANVPGYGDELSLGDLNSQLQNRRPTDPNGSRYSRDEALTGITWQRQPGVRREVADEVRGHLDGGGTIANRQQRDEMLRVVALDITESTRGGLMPDYNRIAGYYERAGRPIDDDFVRYLSQPVTQGQLNDTFAMQARLVESRMAVERLRSQARVYSDEIAARRLELSPADGRTMARQLQEQIKEIERMENIIRARIAD